MLEKKEMKRKEKNNLLEDIRRLFFVLILKSQKPKSKERKEQTSKQNEKGKTLQFHCS